MILFTNSTNSRFFINDDHVKNLHTIEVNSVADLLNNKVCEISYLLKYTLMKIDELSEIVVLDDGGNALVENAYNFPFLEYLTYAEIVEQAVDQIIKSKPDHESGVAEAKKFIRELETVCNAAHQIGVSNAAIVFCTPDDSKLIVRVSDNAVEINPSDIDSPEIKLGRVGRRSRLPHPRELFSPNE